MVESFGSSGTGFMLYVNSRAVGVREKMTFGMPQVLVCAACVWEAGEEGRGGRGGVGWEVGGEGWEIGGEE